MTARSTSRRWSTPCVRSTSIPKNPIPCPSRRRIVTNSTEVKVPDIGGFKDVSVIDVLVQDGQQIDKETPLITLETEKAAMDVPAPTAGRVIQVKVKQGDKVSEGSVILLIEAAAAAESAATAQPDSSAKAPATAPSASTGPVA